MSFASHLMLRPRLDRVLAASPGGRRALADTVLRVTRPFELLGFRAADTHMHVLLGCDEAGARECGRRIEIGLTQRLRLDPGFALAYARPVVDQRHLRNAFGYILRQEERHEIARDPFHDASSLPDLLGLRVRRPDLVRRVGEWLPRVRLAELWSLLPEGVEPVAAGVLSDSAAAALALPRLGLRWPDAIEARAGAVQAAPHLGTGALSDALTVSTATIRRLRSRPVDPRLARAVVLQARMRTGHQARGAESA